MRSHVLLRGLCFLAAAAFIAPLAHAADLLVSNFGNSTITRYDLATRAQIGTHGGGSGLTNPLCARVGPDGKLYVTSEGSNSVLRFDVSTGVFLDTFVPAGSGGLTQPTGLDWGPDGNLYVASFDGDSVLKYDRNSGAFLGTFVTPGSGALNGADNGTIFGPDGNLYVPSYFGNSVLKYDGHTGNFIGSFASIGRPRVLAFSGEQVLITSETTNSVRRYNATTGAFLSSFGAGKLSTPIGLALDSDGMAYVTSSRDNRVVQFNAATGAFVRDFANISGGVSLPAFITIVPAPGGVLMLTIAGLSLSRRARR